MKINNSNIYIQEYEKKFDKDFYILNKTWIEESWILEESDKKDLLNPKKIFDNGGQVFFAVHSQITIGTVAMIKNSEYIFELAKMTVKEGYRGNGIANMLMNQCINFAKQNNAEEIFLISNDSLTIARNLYDKYGFKEVDLDSQKYDRGNVKMRLTLD